ncbi:MAG: putative toxin-antitoxin system toxin component, PIN family [Chloroflexota bacterium]|nr:MAG: putative toxin-antitoxin system toxin component, PIN family [Chloroflexota bacterium]
MRAVIDTVVFVSALINRRGTTGGVLHALREGRFISIYSTPTLVEIVDVLGRDKFRTKYHIRQRDIIALVNLIRLRGELVIPSQPVTACRDSKDDKFLEAALTAKADCLVSGDFDLLDMIVFEDIPILRPAEFLDRLSKDK